MVRGVVRFVFTFEKLGESTTAFAGTVILESQTALAGITHSTAQMGATQRRRAFLEVLRQGSPNPSFVIKMLFDFAILNIIAGGPTLFIHGGPLMVTLVISPIIGASLSTSHARTQNL